jgi:hypothetical protein
VKELVAYKEKLKIKSPTRYDSLKRKLTTSSILKPSSIFGASSIIKSKCGSAHL